MRLSAYGVTSRGPSAVIGVSTMPGHTLLTRIAGASSAASAHVRVTTPGWWRLAAHSPLQGTECRHWHKGTVNLAAGRLADREQSGSPEGMTTPVCPSYAGYRFPAEVISHAVWLYFKRANSMIWLTQNQGTSGRRQMKVASAASVIGLAVLLAVAGGRPISAADQTPTQPQQHPQRTKTRVRPAAPSLGRQPGGRQEGARHEGGRQQGARYEREQRRFGRPGAPALPGLPAAVPAIVGGILGGIMAQPQPGAPPGYPSYYGYAQPAAPSGYWYYCDASGQYYPYVATCASRWRGVRPR